MDLLLGQSVRRMAVPRVKPVLLMRGLPEERETFLNGGGRSPTGPKLFQELRGKYSYSPDQRIEPSLLSGGTGVLFFTGLATGRTMKEFTPLIVPGSDGARWFSPEKKSIRQDGRRMAKRKRALSRSIC